MEVNIVYEVKNSKGKMTRYSELNQMSSFDCKKQEYHMAITLETNEHVVLDNNGDVIWKNVLGKPTVYKKIGKFILFMNESETNIKSFGIISGGETVVVKKDIIFENATEIGKKVSYKTDGIYLYGELLIIMWENYLKVYQGTKMIVDRPIVEGGMKINEFDDISYLQIFFYATDIKSRKCSLFFDEKGTELELKLVPKKQE